MTLITQVKKKRHEEWTWSEFYWNALGLVSLHEFVSLRRVFNIPVELLGVSFVLYKSNCLENLRLWNKFRVQNMDDMLQKLTTSKKLNGTDVRNVNAYFLPHMWWMKNAWKSIFEVYVFIIFCYAFLDRDLLHFQVRGFSFVSTFKSISETFFLTINCLVFCFVLVRAFFFLMKK